MEQYQKALKIHNCGFTQRRKKNYFLLGSYRPIAFKNTLAKVLKKHIANIISKAMEKYGLFLWNQMGAKCKQSTLLMVKLLSFCVQTMWRTHHKYMVSMLKIGRAHV